MISIGCARESHRIIEHDLCIIPSCVDTIIEYGLRPVNCGVNECKGEELRKYDANTADLLNCIERVQIQMRECE